MVIQVKHMTAAEFDEFVQKAENVERLFEYIGGEVVEGVSNNYSSVLGMFIGSAITMYVEERALGYVTGADGGYMVSGERYIPDAAYISKTRQPEPCHEAHNPKVPDLAVEVLSPTNAPDSMGIKVVNYLLAGTTVWVVDPDKQQVEVYVPNQSPKTVGIDGTLDGGEVLPGFKLAVSRIFAR